MSNQDISTENTREPRRTWKYLFLGCSFIFIAGISFSYGFLSYHYKWPPNDLILRLYKGVNDPPRREYTGDIENMIQITTGSEVSKKRNELIRYIWKSEKFPTEKQPTVESNITDEQYSDISSLKSIDKLTMEMDLGFNSIAYHFHATNPNGKLLIYHQGHDGNFFLGKPVITEFLNNGYDVIALSMPLLGMNNQPELALPPFGKITFTDHELFKFIDDEKFSSIKLFIEPVVVSLNYATKSGYTDIYMTGISGGGWTTVLSSAIDPRISKSYPVAGSYPTYVRTLYELGYGDYEQYVPALYRIAEFLDLYLLGSFGENRKQVQIVNVYEPCCFGGRGYETYEEILQEKLKKIGKGSFAVFPDTTHREHQISTAAVQFMLKDITAQ